MNMELFYKKVYTVAFRLTGDEKNAEDMAVSAIIKISGYESREELIKVAESLYIRE